MRIQENELENYLGRNLSEINGKISRATLSTLSDFEANLRENGLRSSLVSYLTIAHQFGSKPLTAIAKELDITYPTLKKIIRFYGIPTLSQKEALARKWKDEEFRKRNADATRKNWQDEEFRKRNADAVRKNWQDEEFRKRNADAVRKARASTSARVAGYRSDIERATDSTGEANLIRVLAYSDRELQDNTEHTIKIPKKMKKLFRNKTKSKEDYITVKDQRGNLKAYKFMPRPQKRTYASAKLAQEQHGIPVTVVTEKMYRRLEDRFKERVKADKKFSGWETLEDNFSNNTRYR